MLQLLITCLSMNEFVSVLMREMLKVSYIYIYINTHLVVVVVVVACAGAGLAGGG